MPRARRPTTTPRQLVAASIEGRLRQVAGLLLADPGIAERSLAAAAVLGDTNSVRARLVADAEAALAVDDERGWPPLLYACYSRWHHIDSGRAVGLAQVVKLLLDVGASPHTNNGAFRDGYRSALRGAVEVNNPRVVEVLLEAGANPDDGRCIEQAADRRRPTLSRIAARPEGPGSGHLGSRRGGLRRRLRSGLPSPRRPSDRDGTDGKRGHQRAC